MIERKTLYSKALHLRPGNLADRLTAKKYTDLDVFTGNYRRVETSKECVDSGFIDHFNKK